MEPCKPSEITSSGVPTEIEAAPKSILGTDISPRHLDRLVGEKVMGFWIYHYDKGYKPYWMLVTEDLDPVNYIWRENERGSEEEAWEKDCPHYSTDLNDCFEAQARFCDMGCHEAYLTALYEIVTGDAQLGTIDQWMVFTTATAEQRCVAMLMAAQEAVGDAGSSTEDADNPSGSEVNTGEDNGTV